MAMGIATATAAEAAAAMEAEFATPTLGGDVADLGNMPMLLPELL